MTHWGQQDPRGRERDARAWHGRSMQGCILCPHRAQA